MRRSPKQIATAFVALAAETPEGELETFVRRFVRSIERRHQRKLLPAVLAATRDIIDAQEGRKRFRITTASATDEAAMRGLVGTHAIVTSRTDPGIIGGAIVEQGDERTDGSVRTALAQLRNTLLSREL